jgi:hypothetical protein
MSVSFSWPKKTSTVATPNGHLWQRCHPAVVEAALSLSHRQAAIKGVIASGL